PPTRPGSQAALATRLRRSRQRPAALPHVRAVRRGGVRRQMTSESGAGPSPVLVVDFGAQYAQLIARRVRECQVYSQIVPSTMSVSEMLALRPAAIILSGGPASVY